MHTQTPVGEVKAESLSATYLRICLVLHRLSCACQEWIEKKHAAHFLHRCQLQIKENKIQSFDGHVTSTMLIVYTSRVSNLQNNETLKKV